MRDGARTRADKRLTKRKRGARAIAPLLFTHSTQTHRSCAPHLEWLPGGLCGARPSKSKNVRRHVTHSSIRIFDAGATWGEWNKTGADATPPSGACWSG
jgi:hypothetical protein